jgi:GDPmannose 4,6-dehydratase
MKKTALITGITGQDGFYLAEMLLEKGYRIIGTARNVKRIALSPIARFVDDIELIAWDMRNQRAIVEILSTFRPMELYNFAAYSSGTGMYDDPIEICEVNGMAIVRLLEGIREVDSNIRFCQASSREIFGEAQESPQSERTPVSPRSPYGAAKLYADCMIKMFRQRYGLFACSAILFNHESPYRRLEFVTRKITHTCAQIKLGQASELQLGNLDACRDWGFAGDYVFAMWLMLQAPLPDDYVLASGEAHSVREFCQYAFSYLGLDHRRYIKEDTAAYRPAEPMPLIGDATKAREVLGWAPKVGFVDLVNMMTEADLQIATRNIASNGKRQN